MSFSVTIIAMWKAFWGWYERNYTLNISVASCLFILQLVHLIWLGGDVVAARLLGNTLFDLRGVWQVLIVLVDYTEIPAIFTMTLVYIDAWRRGARASAIVMLTLLHAQWLHLFWITDEFVVDTLSGVYTHVTMLPGWLAWTAIAIDYLEVPVMVDTMYKLVHALRGHPETREVAKIFQEVKF